jgi:hypothetical protein
MRKSEAWHNISNNRTNNTNEITQKEIKQTIPVRARIDNIPATVRPFYPLRDFIFTFNYASLTR